MITQTGLKNRHFWMITQTGLNWVSLRCTGFGLIGRRHLKSPGNIIFFLQTWEYIMFLNNKIIFLVIVFNDFYVIKIFFKLCGGDSAYPFCDVNRGRLCLDRTSNTRTCKYIQVLVLSLYVRKRFFLAFFQQSAAKQLKMGSVCKVVQSDVFSSAVQQTLWAVML